MSVIQEFLEDYKRDAERYEKLAKICAHQCERGLKRRGLRALVTYRAKRLDSLAAKVESRAKRKNYQTVADIYDDILDLAGVRIALYFPKDKEEVDSFVRNTFEVEAVKDFPRPNNRTPYPKRFSGYAARHYRLKLKIEGLSSEEEHLADHVIEVQVGSVLMHAWAEVEHDLVYKSRRGLLSQDEYAILDELNGLMHAGEIALERLQRAVKRRINTELQPFSNHYELSSFLYDYSKAAASGETSEPFIGRTDVLFHFLRKIELNSIPNLKPILEKCKLNSKREPIARQIIDHILQQNPDNYQAYNQARLTVGRVDPFSTIQETLSYFSDEQGLDWFMRQWIAFKKETRGLLKEASASENDFDPETRNKLEQIRRLRDRVLHGDHWPAQSEMLEAGIFLQDLREKLQVKKKGEGQSGFSLNQELKPLPKKKTD
ncbi:MAG: RelA/SpoT domain-containing protein [Firmicutes bacterium]|nr:RelA/SpoT domain-containing protein [Bacillota bacterium]